jgi:hypothetical protein
MLGTQLRSVQRALRWRRRVRLTVRAVWLALAAWCVGLGAIVAGVPVPLPVPVAVAVLTFACGVAYAWWSQPSLAQLTHGLDRFFDQHDQTVTALEIARRGPANAIEARVIHDATNWLAELRRYVAGLPLVPWREAETLLAVALVSLALTVAIGPRTPTAQSPLGLPALPPPAAPTAVAAPQASDLPVNGQSGTMGDPAAQAVVDALGDVLAPNGATRPAADALRRGDLEAAASELRELADGADQLGDEARNEVADQLRKAADQLRAAQPELADRLEQQASGLAQGGQAAAQALEDLARTVEGLGQAQVAQASPGAQPGDAQDGAGGGDAQQSDGGSQAQEGSGGGAGSVPGSETRSTPPSAAQAQGSDLPLPSSATSGGATTDARGSKGPSIEIEAGGTGGTDSAGGNTSGEAIQSEADPLAIPPEYRDVVENYFTPAP